MKAELDHVDTDLEQRIRTVIGDVFGLDPADVGPETSKDTVKEWDSLQHLTLVLALEEEFGLHFSDEETVSLLTFPLIVVTVSDHLS